MLSASMEKNQQTFQKLEQHLNSSLEVSTLKTTTSKFVVIIKSSDRKHDVTTDLFSIQAMTKNENDNDNDIT